MFEVFYNLLGYNTELFILINQYNNNLIIANISYYIDAIFYLPNFAILYFFYCIYCYYKIKTDRNFIMNFSAIYDELMRIGLCYAIFAIIFTLLKFSVNMPRPFCSLPSSDFITFIDISTKRCLSSFPSAHTGLAIIIAYFLWSYINKLCKFFVCTLVVIVALSRIILAVHYPADIIYGAIITAILIITSNYIYKLLQKPIFNPLKKYLMTLHSTLS